ncbi:hypothetical protein BH23PAT2_BH23PAT2_08910 [soil metagenome]
MVYKSSNKVQRNTYHQLSDDFDGAIYLSGEDEKNSFLDEIIFGDIEQRINESIRDDTHPSTDSDADSQEMYDEGFIR